MNHSHVHSESITGLSFESESVRAAAQLHQSDKLSNYQTMMLIVRFSMNHLNGTKLPDDIHALLYEFSSPQPQPK